MSKEQLLADLTETVKRCTTRFKCKFDVAMESSPIVASLCLDLENIFVDGIRRRTFQPYPLDILWEFVMKYLGPHERHYYESLKHVTSDTGRSRAWIRSMLNEHSLERYIKIFLADRVNLEKYFIPSAFLRDHQYTTILSSISGELNSLLFAVNVDTARLNDSTTSESCTVLKKKTAVIVPISEFKNDPPIADLPDLIVKGVRRRASPTLKPVHRRRSETDIQQLSRKEDNIVFLTEQNIALKKLLEKENAVIGSLQSKMVCVRRQHNEEVDRLQARLNRVEQENERLKSELQRYIHRVVVPPTSGGVEDVKFSKITEMNGELCELNAVLQQQLLLKESETQCSSSQQNLLNLAPFKISIPSVCSKSLHDVYSVVITTGEGHSWSVLRRYSDFFGLHREMQRVYGQLIGRLDFPPKIRLGNRLEAVIENRRVRLEQYLNELGAIIASNGGDGEISQESICKMIPFLSP